MYTAEFEQVISGSSSEKPVPLGDYPVSSVIGVLANQTDAMQSIRTLRANGFPRSEIHPLAGDAAADALHDHTGHGRLLDAVLRVAERWGIVDEEMELKAKLEEALRDGRVLILVATPSAERRALATRVLRRHGASSIHLMGHFTITDVPVRSVVVDERSAA